MTTARAAVAGMLSTVIVLWASQGGIGDEFTQPELTALLVLTAVILLLVVPDAVGQWRRLRGKRSQQDEEE